MTLESIDAAPTPRMDFSAGVETPAPYVPRGAPARTEEPNALGLEMAAEALAQLGSPALIFDECGKALIVNALVARLGACVKVRGRSVAFHDRADDVWFRRAASELGAAHGPSQAIHAVGRSSDGAKIIARILAVGAGAASGGARTAMLVFSTLDSPQPPSSELLQSLFDLTPAEARVARALAGGATVGQMASRAKVSRNTVRSQLRAILGKTGCHRQADAVSLLSRAGLASGGAGFAARA